MLPRVLAVLALALCAGAASGASFDCAKAGSKIEKRLCADPELSRLDERIAAGFAAELQGLDPALQQRAREFQRQWIRCRNASGDELLAVMRQRAKDVEGVHVDLGGLAFLRLGGAQRPMFLVTALPGTAAYNHWVAAQWEAAKGDNSEQEYAADSARCAGKDDCEAQMATHASEPLFASPALVSVQQTSTWAQGGAHPNDEFETHTFWLAHAGELRPADMFEGDGYKKVVTRYARQAVAKELERGDVADDRIASFLEPAHWGVTATSLHIRIQGQDAGLQRGPSELDVPWSAFGAALRAAFAAALKH